MQPGFTRAASAFWWIVLALSLLGAIVRLYRLDWQPLWWDEGYSVYFATEPPARMAWLTARDIHPPLYFLLAHLWVNLLESTRPEVFRTLSVIVAVPAIPLTAQIARLLFTNRPLIAYVTALCMVFSPVHLYYSQEVRMYGLALTLTLGATALLLYLARAEPHDRVSQRRRRFALAAYIALATLSLYTLYYAGLLVGAHAAWYFWIRRRGSLRHNLASLAPFAVVGLLYVPWIAYALPQLIPYIQNKVVADEDTPLGLLDYGWRHLLAFSGGHLEGSTPLLEAARHTGVLAPLLCLAALGFANVRFCRTRGRSPASGSTNAIIIDAATDPPAPNPVRQGSSPTSPLLLFLALPFVGAFLINLWYPFFPIGGERLLLITAPYFILLVVAYSIHGRWAHPFNRVRLLPIALLIVAGLSGAYIFATTPRYVNEDYRPIVRTVISTGRPHDSVMVIFPWQVGYWRAYAPREVGVQIGPQPHPVDQDVLVWDHRLRTQIDAYLRQGTVWFPAPLGFGSTLPHEIEEYLQEQAVNAFDAWMSESTRLSAWTRGTPALGDTPAHINVELPAQFDGVALVAAQVETSQAASGNNPVALRLAWAVTEATHQHRVTLDLIEQATGRVWTSRTYEPLGRYSNAPASHSRVHTGNQTTTATAVDEVALIVPAGLPSGEYFLSVNVSRLTNDLDLISNDAQRDPAPPDPDAAVRLATLTIVPPAQPLSPYRLPIELPDMTRSDITHLRAAGLGLLGLSHVPASDPILAGSEIEPILYAVVTDSLSEAAGVMLQVRSPDNAILAETQQWEVTKLLPTAPHTGGLLSLPLRLLVPGNISGGDRYTLWAGVGTPEDHTLREFATVRIVQRRYQFQPPEPIDVALSPSPQLGTHVQMMGYGVQEQTPSSDHREYELALHWRVLQPIIPVHHIFLHIYDRAGNRIAQRDGAPHTPDGPAPTGSWVADEYLTTLHSFSSTGSLQDLHVQVGLYEPTTQVRLPVSVAGETVGDSILLHLDD